MKKALDAAVDNQTLRAGGRLAIGVYVASVLFAYLAEYDAMPPADAVEPIRWLVIGAVNEAAYAVKAYLRKKLPRE